MVIAILFIVPWLATFAGSVLGAKVQLRTTGQQGGLLGFAAGVMVAACVWSLILPAFAALQGAWGLWVASIGFAMGCAFMLLLDKILPHQHSEEENPEGVKSTLSRPFLLVLAVVLHNIPEGLALGVVMAGMSAGGVSTGAALAFGAGLALQNLPEGIAVTVPLRQSGTSERRCLWLGTIASFAEPLFALIGLWLTLGLASMANFALPLLLCIAAGAMLFVVVEELIPASQALGAGHAATYGFLLGFWGMAAMGALGG